MGFAVPAAIGVQVANRERRPLVLVGDGAFQMTGMELSTAVRLKFNPIVIVLNNKGYTTERFLQEGPFNDLQEWRFHELPAVIGGGVGHGGADRRRSRASARDGARAAGFDQHPERAPRARRHQPRAASGSRARCANGFDAPAALTQHRRLGGTIDAKLSAIRLARGAGRRRAVLPPARPRNARPRRRRSSRRSSSRRRRPTAGSRTAATSTTSATRRSTRINRDNVATLKPAWRTHLNGSGTDSKYSGQAQPIVYDGVIYIRDGRQRRVRARRRHRRDPLDATRRISTRTSPSSAAAG